MPDTGFPGEDLPAPSRPALTAELTPAEFQRWYWRLDELVPFARSLGLRASGSKAVLTARIVAWLGGQVFPEPAQAQRPRGAQLTAPVSATTVIPAGQRCSQVLRGWMRDQLGSGFHFDAAMRDFFSHTDGSQIMGDALEHWYATRDLAPGEIGSQFEFNRFTRAWHREHPDGARADALRAWRKYRDTPIGDPAP